MTEYFNCSEQKNVRRTLRKEMPRAERRLWWKLRGRQLDGLRFRRQFSVGRYVIDFYCPEKTLAIEIDGDTHFEEQAEKRDAIRQRYIESFGIHVLRFVNSDVFKHLNAVLEEISRVASKRVARTTPLKQCLECNQIPHPNPPLRKGRE